jgi:hypothetical protein
MSDPQVSPRFGLPLLSVGQAQKEVTHNEALMLIDALVHCRCEAGPQIAPPAAPSPGQSWIVDVGATDEWIGQDKAIALWSDGGWRFIAPRVAMRCVRLSDGKVLRFDGDSWVAPPILALPAGGTTVDSTARDAIAALIGALSDHGLLISG